MSFARIVVGFLLLSVAATTQQYVISTYAGGAPPAIPSPAVAGSIGAPVSVATDAIGNVYFVSFDFNVVFKLDPDGVLTRVAGNSRLGYSGDGGPATSAHLRLGQGGFVSEGLAVDSAGNLFIVDAGNYCIRRVSPDGIITTVAGNGTRGFSGDGGPATSAQLWPWSVAVDSAGNLFIADTNNFRVRKVSASGIITTVAGGGTLADADGGPATSAILTPSSVAVDSDGNLFVADGSFHEFPEGRIRKVTPDGIITTVAGGGQLQGAESDGGPAASALLGPLGVAIDGAGNLFVADRRNYRIRKVSPNGIITTVAGDGTGRWHWEGGGPVADDGPATDARLSYPRGVAVDGASNLFIADTNNNRVRKVSTDGIITTVAGNGTAGFSGDGGPATSAQLDSPIAVTVDDDGNLFLLDIANAVSERFPPTG